MVLWHKTIVSSLLYERYVILEMEILRVVPTLGLAAYKKFGLDQIRATFHCQVLKGACFFRAKQRSITEKDHVMHTVLFWFLWLYHESLVDGRG